MTLPHQRCRPVINTDCEMIRSNRTVPPVNSSLTSFRRSLFSPRRGVPYDLGVMRSAMTMTFSGESHVDLLRGRSYWRDSRD